MLDQTIPVSRQSTSTAPVVATPTSTLQPQSVASAPVFDFPTEYIDLPSQGHFYSTSSPLSSGRIQIKYMTAREEDILTNQNLIKKGIVLDELLRAIIVTPNVKLDDLLIGDKNGLFVACRRLAYGDKYPAKVTCPKCDTESEVEVNLSEMKAKELSFENYTKGENLFNFQLPISKKKITYKLLTHKDENDIDTEIKALAKIVKTNTPEMTTRLKYMIQAVDDNSDRVVVKKFVENMLAKDSVVFRKHVRDNTPDFDMTFNFKCPACGHEERMAMPMGVDFFWPSS